MYKNKINKIGTIKILILDKIVPSINLIVVSEKMIIKIPQVKVKILNLK